MLARIPLILEDFVSDYAFILEITHRKIRFMLRNTSGSLATSIDQTGIVRLFVRAAIVEMRPPPRKRTKVDRSLKPESACQRSSKKVFKLQRTEQRKLLKELKRLNRSTGGSKEIDYPFLRKSLLNRSISEVTVSYVLSVAQASFNLLS